MNREARASPDVMITSAAPVVDFILFLSLVPYNKQVTGNNLDRSVVTGKSQTSAYRIDLAITWSIRQGLSLRFSHNNLTLGY